MTDDPFVVRVVRPDLDNETLIVGPFETSDGAQAFCNAPKRGEYEAAECYVEAVHRPEPILGDGEVLE